MKYLVSLLVLVSIQAFAEEDLIAQFERTVCKTEAKTKKVVCSLDGKQVPSELENKHAQQNSTDDELDVTTQVE